MTRPAYVVRWHRGMTGETGYAPARGTTDDILRVTAYLHEAVPVSKRKAEAIAAALRRHTLTTAYVRKAP